MRRALLITLLAPAFGCGALTTSTPADALRCGSAETTQRVECPSPAALASHLRDRWGLAAEAGVTTTCLPGKFPERAWLVHAVTDGGPPVRSATFLLQSSCAALTDPDPGPVGDGDREVELELHDLDGDAIDEVIVRRHQAEGRTRTTTLEVFRLAAARLLPAGKVRLAHDDGVTYCTSAVNFRPHPDGGLLIEIETAGTAAAGACLEPGIHALELRLQGLQRRRGG